jgi:hypothetical protein
MFKSYLRNPRNHLKTYLGYGILEGYLRGYINLPKGYLGVSKAYIGGYTKAYLRKHLKAYPSYGIPRGYLGDSFRPI